MSEGDPDLDDLIRRSQPEAHALPQTPKRFTPGVDLKGDGSGVVSANVPVGAEVDWSGILAEFGFGGQLEVLRVDKVRMWDAIGKGGEVHRMRHVTASVVQRADAADLEDVDELKERIWSSSEVPASVVPRGTPDGWLVATLTDWQAGKAEGGGSRALVDRVKACIRALIAHVTDLRMGLGLRLPSLCLVGLGDLVEGCLGFPGGTLSRDLHMRQQRAVVRGLLLWALKELRPYFGTIQLRAVPGNHGELRDPRSKGNAMHPADNADVGVVDTVRDVVAEAPWSDGISVWTTSMVKPELTMSWELDGVGLFAGHGHMARGGVAKVPTWIRDLIGTGQVSQGVQIALTGHYHHLRYVDCGNLTWIQSPALDGGSAWFAAGGGEVSRPGLLTFACLPSSGRGLDHLRVLDP